MMVKNFIFLFKLRQKSKIIVNSVGVEARGGGARGGDEKCPVAPLEVFPHSYLIFYY